jgi:hypothetical protein
VAGVLAPPHSGVSAELPGQQHAASIRRHDRCVQVGRRILTVELERLEHRVERRGDLGPSTRLRAVVILAPYDRAANGSLGGVVVQWNPRVVDEAREALPVRQGVRRCLANRDRRERGLLPEPRLELGQHHHGFGSAQLREARGVAFGLPVDLIERTDPRERLLGLGVICLGLFELAKRMRLIQSSG